MRISIALDQAALLEGVEDPDELAPVDPERVRDRRLGLPLALVEQGEHAVAVRVEPGVPELLEGPALAGVAEPGQEECGIGEHLLRDPERRGGAFGFLVRGCDHGNKCSPANRC